MSSTKRFELTHEQKAVVESTADHFAVRASAGAGKTSVLVELFLRKVTEEGFEADQILTITFTRKAAAEMKRRIVSRLLEAKRPDQAQIAETGPIQTIHGFCERMLRENALAAGLDPDFEVMEGAQKSRVFEDCLRNTLIFPPDNCPEASELITKLVGKFGYQDRQPHDKLSKAIRDVIETLRGAGASIAEIREKHRTPDAVYSLWRSSYLETLSPAVRERLEPLLEQDFVKELRAMKEPVPSGMTQSVQRTPDAIREAAKETCGLVQLACATWELLEQAMADLRCLDFTKLEASAVQLLEQNAAVRERLQKQYRLVLVDESQDLNPMQYRLLQALDLGRSMMVGDAQQSIYGFRQADVRLFQETTEQKQTLNLSRNHRADQGVLGFIDDLFLNIWQPNYIPMGDRPDPSDFDTVYTPNWSGVELWVQPDKDISQVADWVSELQQEGVRPGEIAILTRMNRFAIDMQSALESRGIPARVVGGTEKFFTRLVVRDVANALRAMVDPYDDFALLTVLRSPFCGISIDSVTLLASQKPVIEALAEFEPPVDEDTERIRAFLDWFDSLKLYADRLPAWEAISELYSNSGYLEKLARKSGCNQMIANARKLLTLAASEPELGPLEFAERIREIQEMGHREGDAPAVDEDVEAVTLMTIHKAKGLEFPVVVVPEVYGSLVRINGDVMIDPWLQLVATKFSGLKSFYTAWLIERRRKREEEEEWRLFYVALTRAKSRLCLCTSRQARVSSSLAARVAKEIGLSGGLPDGVRLRESDAPQPTE